MYVFSLYLFILVFLCISLNLIILFSKRHISVANKVLAVLSYMVALFFAYKLISLHSLVQSNIICNKEFIKQELLWNSKFKTGTFISTSFCASETLATSVLNCSSPINPFKLINSFSISSINFVLVSLLPFDNTKFAKFVAILPTPS